MDDLPGNKVDSQITMDKYDEELSLGLLKSTNIDILCCLDWENAI